MRNEALTTFPTNNIPLFLWLRRADAREVNIKGDNGNTDYVLTDSNWGKIKIKGKYLGEPIDIVGRVKGGHVIGEYPGKLTTDISGHFKSKSGVPVNVSFKAPWSYVNKGDMFSIKGSIDGKDFNQFLQYNVVSKAKIKSDYCSSYRYVVCNYINSDSEKEKIAGTVDAMTSKLPDESDVCEERLKEKLPKGVDAKIMEISFSANDVNIEDVASGNTKGSSIFEHGQVTACKKGADTGTIFPLIVIPSFGGGLITAYTSCWKIGADIAAKAGGIGAPMISVPLVAGGIFAMYHMLSRVKNHRKFRFVNPDGDYMGWTPNHK